MKQKQIEKEKKQIKIPEAKIRAVKDLAEKMNKARTLMIVSIKSLPSRQFQNIKKSIREHATVQIAKKNIILRAIKSLGRESILPLEKNIGENCAFIISDIEGFELAGILAKKKTSAYAKARQIAPEDIEVKKGPTDLVPGPAISELGNLGIQIAVENGKISIKKDKVIVGKGREISENAASILQKLNIQPFTIGLEPVAVYDAENEKIYTDIKIDSDEVAENLKNAANKALGFAQKIVYYCKETISYFLAKANSERVVLSKFFKEESREKSEENVEYTEKENANSASQEEAEEDAETEAEVKKGPRKKAEGSKEAEKVKDENKEENKNE